MYKISVAIPAYNEEANIGMLLKSLLSQRSRNYELNKIIVASDGSNDKTLEIAKLFNNERIAILEGRKRIGQISRQNQAFDTLMDSNDLILLLEADTLPATEDYIEKLVEAIPQDNRFSYICGDTITTNSTNLISHVLNVGYELRHELFLHQNRNNLYLSTGGRLFSHEFAKKFRWNKGYHEDSYCYRKAVESGLPIIFSPDAKTYFKSVETISDYLAQSTKFQKAKDKESSKSEIYKVKTNKLKLIQILIKYLLIHPIATPIYLLMFAYSRIVSRFAKEYDQFWKIYSSSKNLKSYNKWGK